MVYVLLGTGFEEVGALTPVDLLRRAGISVLTVGLNGKMITGGHGITVEADICVEEMDLTDLEMLVLPGGLGGVASIRSCEAAMNAIRFAYENDRLLGAICAGPTVLGDLGITNGKTCVCFPGCESGMGTANIVTEAAVQDGKLITGTSTGCALPFALKLIEAIKGSAAAEAIGRQIVIR